MRTALLKITLIAGSITLAMLATAARAVAPGPDITCRMSVPAKVTTRGNIPLTFELVNHTKFTQNILNWDTPLEGFYRSYLDITGPDGAVEYRGRVVKRGPPTREEYVSIKRGDKLVITVNLAPAYDFKARGKHEISFNGKLMDATKEKIPRTYEMRTPMDIDCPSVVFDLAAAPVATK